MTLHCLFRGWLQFPIPDFLTLDRSYQVHDAYKYEEERTQETKQGDKPSAIEFFHGPSQSFSDDVHTGYHHQREEEWKDKSEDDRPAQRAPEHYAVTSKENIGTKMLKQAGKVDIEPHCKR